METAFEKQAYMDHRLIWSGSIGGEENAECVVPDSMPDLGAIVDTDATLSLRSKELSGGRLSVTADISAKILYQPEGENVLGQEYFEFYVDEEKLDQLILRLFYAPKE